MKKITFSPAKFVARTFILAMTALLSTNTYAQNADTDYTLGAKITGKGDIKMMFPLNKYVLDLSFSNNGAQVEKLDGIFSNSSALFGLDSLVIASAASVDGPYDNNEMLATNRAERVRTFLVERYPQIDPKMVKINAVPEDWAGLRTAVMADDRVPNRTDVLKIIDSKATPNTKEARLRALDGGTPWRYLINYILPQQRYGASVVFHYDMEKIARAKRDTIYLPMLIVDTIKVKEGVIFPTPYKVMAEPCAQYNKFAIKTNLLYAGLTLTPNLAFEMKLADKWTLDVSAGYNPWNRDGKPGDNKKLVHWLGQVEGRYFLERAMYGHFFGAHLLGGQYNISNYNLPFNIGSSDYRYEGWAAGVGLSYGYQWCISERFALEATIGAGYVYTNYDLYTHPRCGYLVAPDLDHHYFGITRAGVSLMYKFGKNK